MTPKQELRLYSRAIKEGWPVSQQQRESVLATAAQLLASGDPKLIELAADIVFKAEAINIKREELEAKGRSSDEDRRLQLLGLARLAASRGIDIDGAERPNEGPAAEGG
jgi:hypothetical protein